MRLPGHLQKWSTAAPPELRVSTDSASKIRILLEPRGVFAGSKPEPREYGIEEPILIWDLENEDLLDGDYLVSVFLDGTTQAESTHTLRLRSADMPALLLPQDEPPLRHAPQDLMFGLSAGRSEVEADSFRCAPVVDGQLSAMPPPEGVPAWYSERKSGPRSERRPEALVFPDPGDSSCMTTGAHLMQIETGGPGMASVEGVCKYCGLVKRYPTRGKKKGQGSGRAKTKFAPTVNVQELAAVRHGAGPDWTVGFDAVCHVGQGKLAALHRVAQQIEPGSLFSDLFVRRLEMLGHVEIQRDAISLQPVVWEVVDPTLAGLPSGELLLLGFRSQKSLAVLEDFASRSGATVRTDLDPDGPPVIRLADLRVEKIDDLLGVISEATHRPAKWIPNAAQSLARHLPAMSRLIAALPEVSALGARTFERWDPASARFIDASDASTPGAYRLTGNTRAYVYRTADQVGTMTATLGNARLVKYAAAANSGRRLAGYDRESRVLYVPLGADLPGLFGRAAVLASGFPPLDNPEEGILEYRLVPENIAGQIMNQLSS
ncbi:hypothetical protein OAM92_00385 [Acidimicrobiales bacterium]|nr:hypothetical protein [Acidimicrobiales bacterium]